LETLLLLTLVEEDRDEDVEDVRGDVEKVIFEGAREEVEEDVFEEVRDDVEEEVAEDVLDEVRDEALEEGVFESSSFEEALEEAKSAVFDGSSLINSS